ncbi:hypothetical protein [Lactobacillus phage Bassarid]|nr:hypothetical protein [Lactobacillus phage Bassarid]
MTQEQIDMLERLYNKAAVVENTRFPLYELFALGDLVLDYDERETEIVENMTAEQEIEFLKKYIEMAKEENEYNAKNN